MRAENLEGMMITITPTKQYPTPHGLNYVAKGCYVQGKNLVAVGHVKNGDTTRIAYPLKDCVITLISK